MSEPLLTCRPILPREEGCILEAARINNTVWGESLTSEATEFRLRAERGFLIAAFGPRTLEGTISCLELDSSRLVARVAAGAPAASWMAGTGDGTFSTAEPGADTLCCAAVTSRGAELPPRGSPDPDWTDLPGTWGAWARCLDGLQAITDLPPELAEAADHLLPAYLAANLDPVLRFHARTKGPLPGAGVWLPIRNGRPEDLGALGYNVLMRYPELIPEVRSHLLAVTRYVPSTVGEALVVAAARLASTLPAVRWVVPLSRPAAYRSHLAALFARLAGAPVPLRRLEEETFFEAAKAAL